MNFRILNIRVFAALVLALLPALLLAKSADKARIVTSGQKPAECISPVEVHSIDGELVYVREIGFDLEPGKHSLGARTLVNTSFCKAVGPGTVRDNVEPLVAEFEAGKTYYLGYDHSSANRKDWKLVIWKVEG